MIALSDEAVLAVNDALSFDKYPLFRQQPVLLQVARKIFFALREARDIHDQDTLVDLARKSAELAMELAE